MTTLAAALFHPFGALALFVCAACALWILALIFNAKEALYD
ncbi:hypothetical protein [Alloyangia mangrovi]|nr:hypothetical protein [Alloyangia mangrovi]